jgi:hypothetical protein
MPDESGSAVSFPTTANVANVPRGLFQLMAIIPNNNASTTMVCAPVPITKM